MKFRIRIILESVHLRGPSNNQVETTEELDSATVTDPNSDDDIDLSGGLESVIEQLQNDGFEVER